MMLTSFHIKQAHVDLLIDLSPVVIFVNDLCISKALVNALTEQKQKIIKFIN